MCFIDIAKEITKMIRKINMSDDSDLYLFIVLVPDNQNISKFYASGDNP